MRLRFGDCWDAKTIKWFVSHTAEISNMQKWAHMTDWLMAMHCCQKTTFQFLSVFNADASIFSARNHFCVIFLIVTNTFKIYFWDISDTSRNKHLFQIRLRRLKDVTWKTSFLRWIWDVLKTSQKRHLSWDVFETS